MQSRRHNAESRVSPSPSNHLRPPIWLYLSKGPKQRGLMIRNVYRHSLHHDVNTREKYCNEVSRCSVYDKEFNVCLARDVDCRVSSVELNGNLSNSIDAATKLCLIESRWDFGNSVTSSWGNHFQISRQRRRMSAGWEVLHHARRESY